jgi:serine/threonine-protein kinase
VSNPVARSVDPRATRRLGQTLRGKYTLLRVLGVGGMAAVYLAAHRNKHRVALKMLHAEISSDEDLRARFVREGYVANSIAHRGVVRVLDDDVSEDGAAFLVMELLEGETLHERSDRLGGALPEPEAVALGHELLDVLVAAHAQEIVHRDLKPENLFLTTDGVLKVLDFGIARMRDPLQPGATVTGRIVGTPAFMPPEQARGRHAEIDARTDLWSVGATLFTLISGQHVHAAETVEEHLIGAATTPARSLAEAAPTASAEVVAVVDRALSFAKADRFASAAEMRDALAAAATRAFGGLPRLPPGEAAAVESSSVVSSSSSAAGASGEAETMDARPAVAETRAASASPSAPAAPTAAAPPTTNATRASASQAGPRPLPRAWLAAGAAALGLPGLYALTRPTPPAPPVASASASASGAEPAPRRCAVNKDCDAAGGQPVCGRMGVCLAKRGCQSGKECVDRAGGKPAICNKEEGTCVPLETPECRTLLMQPGDLENDATLWIGAMIAQSGPAGARYGKQTLQTLDLARHDFASITNGVPGARPGDPTRPIAVLACDDGGDSRAPIHHLVEAVRVPAVIGFNRSKDVMDFASELFNPKGVLALAALNMSPMLTTIARSPEGPRLVYRFANNAAAVASVIAAFASEILVKRLALGPDEPLQIAIVRHDNSNQLALADKLVSSLHVHGKSVAQGGAIVRQFTVDPEAEKPDLSRVRAELLDMLPHVIVNAIGDVGYADDFLPRLEREWPAGSRHRPFHLGTSGASNLTESGAVKLASMRPDVRARMFSFDSASSLPPNVKLAIHYSETYAERTAPAETFGPPYDAFYTLAYAIAALGDKPVTGLNLARALPQLRPPGQPIDVGPASIPEAFKLLREGRSVDLAGTTTSLDFDLDTGDSPAELVVMCAKPGAKPGTLKAVDSGLVLEARTGKLAGKMDCP